MYKVSEILSPEERLGAIQLGMMAKFASLGIGPGEAARLFKNAAGGDNKSVESWVSAMLKLGLGLGIPLGTLSYALRSSLKPNTRQNAKLRAGLDQYNNIVSQYKRQIKKDEEDKDDPGVGDYAALSSSSPAYGNVKAAGVSEWADRHPIITLGAGGLITGGALASISAMIADHIEAKRQRKLEKERNSDTISPDTVVLHVRRPSEKLAQSCDGDSCGNSDINIPKTYPSVKVEPSIMSKELKYVKDSSQPREVNGRFASSTLGKSAETGKGGFSWGGMVNEGLGLALFAGSLPLGYAMVGKLHKKLEENRLKSQIAAAQEEYVSLLDGTYADGEKKAEAEEFSRIIGLELNLGIEKDAQQSGEPRTWMGKLLGLAGKGIDKINTGVFGRNIQHLGGGALAAGILTAASSAYITRKLLQAKFDKANPDDEEEPEKVTKILFKNGSAEFEVSPSQALFTVAFIRDYLKDGLPEKTAQASQTVPAQPQYDFGWLDELSASPEGRQAMLDLYSQHMGWGTADPKAYTPAILKAVGMDPSKDNAWARTVMAMRDPETLKRYMPEIQRRMYANINNDPEAWFKMIGDKRNNALVEGGINQWIQNRQKQGGILGWLMGVPGIGDLVKKWMGSFARQTAWGRRMVGKSFLTGAGVDPEMARAISSDARYNYKPEAGTWEQREGVAPLYTPTQPNRPAYLNKTPDSAGTPAEGSTTVDNVFDQVTPAAVAPAESATPVVQPVTAGVSGPGDHTGGTTGGKEWGV